MKEKKKYFHKFLLYIVKLKQIVNISNFILYIVSIFLFFLIDVVSIFLTVETFKTSFTSQLNLFWIENLLHNGIFKKY